MASVGALPDELLHRVLSFLPAHEAVSTSLLARRWRHLWTSAPALRVTGVKGRRGNPGWFLQFVDELLLLRHPGARLDSFELDLDEADFDLKPFLPACETQVNLWLRHALLCQARVLRFRTTWGIYKYGEDAGRFELPYVPVVSQHLQRLDLELVTLNRVTLDFSGCPALVDLRMANCEIFGHMSSPFLKNVSIVGGLFSADTFRTRIYLPGLVSLELSDFAGWTPVLGSMPLLVSAIIRLTSRCGDFCRKGSYGGCDVANCVGCNLFNDGAYNVHGESMLLKGLSEVTELEFSVDSKVFIVNKDIEIPPTFRKLKTLLLSEWCPGVASDLNLLNCFLQHSPILEKLTLQVSQVPKDRVETEIIYGPLEQSFPHSHLKIAEVKCEEVDGRVNEILNILSTYGISLKQVNIQQTNSTSKP